MLVKAIAGGNRILFQSRESPGRARWRTGGKAAFLAALCLALVWPAGVLAAGLQLHTGGPGDLARLETGDQIVLRDQTGEFSFAGQPLDLRGFSGVLGYSSEVGYVATIAGEARVDGATAARGRMLLIPPYGGEPVVERYDAARLRDAWMAHGTIDAPEVLEGLDSLARRQSAAIFFGRLARTSFNAAASGAADAEPGRRAVLGGPAVRGIRFSETTDPAALEHRIVAGFLAALARGDAAEVAQFLDPVSYGAGGLGKQAERARLLMAQSLIAERDWRGAAEDAPVKLDGTDWGIAMPGGANARVSLRVMPEFAYVRAIEWEGPR